MAVQLATVHLLAVQVQAGRRLDDIVERLPREAVEGPAQLAGVGVVLQQRCQHLAGRSLVGSRVQVDGRDASHIEQARRLKLGALAQEGGTVHRQRHGSGGVVQDQLVRAVCVGADQVVADQHLAHQLLAGHADIAELGLGRLGLAQLADIGRADAAGHFRDVDVAAIHGQLRRAQAQDDGLVAQQGDDLAGVDFGDQVAAVSRGCDRHGLDLALQEAVAVLLAGDAGRDVVVLVRAHHALLEAHPADASRKAGLFFLIRAAGIHVDARILALRGAAGGGSLGFLGGRGSSLGFIILAVVVLGLVVGGVVLGLVVSSVGGSFQRLGRAALGGLLQQLRQLFLGHGDGLAFGSGLFLDFLGGGGLLFCGFHLRVSSFVAFNFCFCVRGVVYDADLQQVHFAKVPDVVGVYVVFLGDVTDGHLIKNAVLDQLAVVAAHGGVADLALDKQARGVFPQLHRSAQRLLAVVMLPEDQHASRSRAGCNGFCERARLHNVVVQVHDAEDRSVAGEDALIRYVLCLDLQPLHSQPSITS